jgi:metal-responsive CopG/Arc/MetJ family transcriptional regulator
MKTAVSIPDDIYEEAEALRRALKASRSEIYAQALAAFLGNHIPDRVTQAMNEVVDTVGTKSDEFARAAMRRALDRAEW